MTSCKDFWGVQKYHNSQSLTNIYVHQTVDIGKVDSLRGQRILKHHCLRDLEKYFQEVTPTGLDPTICFYF